MRASWLMLLLVAVPLQARADGNTFNLQLFRPAIDSKGLFTVDSSSLLGHLDFSVGFVGSYAHDVLELHQGDASFRVSDLVTAQLQGALGLYRWLEVGVSLPVHILFGGRGPGYLSPSGDHNLDDSLTFGAQMVGDLGLHTKLRILSGAHFPVGLGLLLSYYAPTGDSAHFLGEGGAGSLYPKLLVDREFGFSRRVRLSLNAGALIRFDKNTFTDRGATLNTPGSKIDPSANGGMPFCYPAPSLTLSPMSSGCGTGLSRSVGSQLTYALGVSGAVVPNKLDLVAELYGYADVTGSAKAFPLEWLAGAKVYLASKSYFEVGAGTGIIPDQTGSPEVRAFVGFIFEPNIGDRDGDGIKDDVDKCPDEPEDRDDFEDEDGCPDPDNDKDGILDRDDQCPNEPGPVENHGCPYGDRDKDGILDKDDECPDEPGPVENHGCPYGDRDKDGILDKDDECPELPGPVENHGCPYNDSDGDGLLDKDDQCPMQWGPKENQGCPPKSITRIRGGHLVVMKPIFFETAKAIIKPESYSTVDAVADTLKANPQLLLVEVQGHADERGDDDYNLQLTEDRAQAVKRYLVEHGVEAARLTAHGYGETRPICREHGPRCWSKNRRVEFVILRVHQAVTIH